MENTLHSEQDIEKQGDLQSADGNLQQSDDQQQAAADSSKAEIKKLQDELAESKDKYLRIYAEFDNHRRRTAKEKIEMIQSASEQLVKELLPVLDDFERGEKTFTDKTSKEAEGFFLIQNKFKKILEQAGVVTMQLAPGSDFNPDLQEAITQVPTPNEKWKGKIVDVVEKGYLLNEKVIRFAKVVIGQ